MSSDHLTIKQDNHHIASRIYPSCSYVFGAHFFAYSWTECNAGGPEYVSSDFEDIYALKDTFFYGYYIVTYLFGLEFPYLPKQSCVSFILRDCLRNWVVVTKTPPP